MIQISNKKLCVSINEKGAELQSICLNNLEYLWQADENYWNKHAPVLFPIIGELKDGKYIFKEKEYCLSRHGFARDKTYSADQTSKNAAVFTLRSNDETLTVYPFEFILKIEYKIKSSQLFCTYIVQNTDVKDLYFSVGGHPAFKLPLSEKFQYTDYVLQFYKDEKLKRYILQNGLLTDNTDTIMLNNKRLPLQPSLFYNDAIVLKNLRSKEIDLTSEKDTHGLKFRFDGFPYFGIWSAKDAPFICLEPWCGIADSIHHDYQLINKEGINKLGAGEIWRETWSVELF